MKLFSFIRNFLLSSSVVILTACGGGGSEGTSATTTSTTLAGTSKPPVSAIPLITTTEYKQTPGVYIPGVVFRHEAVPKNTVVNGEIDVVLAVIARQNFGGVIARANKFEITNFSPFAEDSAGNYYRYSLKWMFHNNVLTLRDAEGDISGRIPYFITIEDEKVLVTFTSGYFGSNEIEKLKLVASMSPYAMKVTMALALTDVVYDKPSDGNILVSSRESVQTMVKVNQIPLPTVEAFTPKLQYSAYWSTAFITAANVNIVCPTDGITRDTCYLPEMEIIHVGGKDLRFSSGHQLYGMVVDGDVSSFSTNFSVSPGQSGSFSIDMMATSYYSTVEISKMVFVVGGRRVMPIVIWNEMMCDSVLEPIARTPHTCTITSPSKG